MPKLPLKVGDRVRATAISSGLYGGIERLIDTGTISALDPAVFPTDLILQVKFDNIKEFPSGRKLIFREPDSYLWWCRYSDIFHLDEIEVIPTGCEHS